MFFSFDERLTKKAKKAIAICETCPVKQECLRAAMVEERDMSKKHACGIRGGMTARQRWPQ